MGDLLGGEVRLSLPSTLGGMDELRQVGNKGVVHSSGHCQTVAYLAFAQRDRGPVQKDGSGVQERSRLGT